MGFGFRGFGFRGFGFRGFLHSSIQTQGFEQLSYGFLPDSQGFYRGFGFRV